MNHSELRNDLFLRACRREPVDRLPVWYMRQAGRYQPEYREIKKSFSLLEITDRPELCAQVTRLPVEQLGVDAAILFSDIMVPLGPMGVHYDIQGGVGPVLPNPLRTQEAVRALRPLSPERDLPHVLETIRLLVADLDVPLIGFAGGPFTLASYMVEGRADLTRDYKRTKQMMHEDTQVWEHLMRSLSEMIVDYLRAQIAAGVSAVQIFDSWVGALDRAEFVRFVLPHLKVIAESLRATDAPVIFFGLHTAPFFPELREIGVDVIGVDWHTPIAQARSALGQRVALQGNLDPGLLLGPWEPLEQAAKAIVEEAVTAPGFIFNLGHGVIKETDPAQLARLTELVHSYSSQQCAALSQR
ncbi:MAG: uroporphyrinogen decarboxylase [Firmicutes bacterium]|nr:uroporphyrinogen decarboxylase [Bacillota bacterium]